MLLFLPLIANSITPRKIDNSLYHLILVSDTNFFKKYCGNRMQGRDGRIVTESVCLTPIS
ncbi:hypothetical protein GCM10007096_04530 [Pullulanibacillus pueri]|uniref:Uncharacterized protein n=1 Tax=Pullulanibacillus pueri TaxID=1437324 RepID=A0A8J2ZSA0_9BACL|nr:hypothetical protein GCM10007096_04530 [Pullulanibacillus pueri]